MIVFLKRLVGIESTQCEEKARFKRNLNGFDERAEELGDIDDKLAVIVKTVDAKQDSIRAARRSAMSGEHMLALPLGGSFGDQEPGTT